MYMTYPSWRFPDDLEDTCRKYRNPCKPRYARPQHSIEYIRDAAFRYDQSLTNGLAWHQVYIPALYFYAQLERGDISKLTYINHPQAYIERFSPFLRDPDYTPQQRVRGTKYPKLLGLSVKEAAKALDISYQHLMNYIWRYNNVGTFLKMVLDDIFIFNRPPTCLIAAANDKRMERLEINYRNKLKYF